MAPCRPPPQPFLTPPSVERRLWLRHAASLELRPQTPCNRSECRFFAVDGLLRAMGTRSAAISRPNWLKGASARGGLLA